MIPHTHHHHTSNTSTNPNKTCGVRIWEEEMGWGIDDEDGDIVKYN
jgi:hypothetical protein